MIKLKVYSINKTLEATEQLNETIKTPCTE